MIDVSKYTSISEFFVRCMSPSCHSVRNLLSFFFRKYSFAQSVIQVKAFVVDLTLELSNGINQHNQVWDLAVFRFVRTSSIHRIDACFIDFNIEQ